MSRVPQVRIWIAVNGPSAYGGEGGSLPGGHLRELVPLAGAFRLSPGFSRMRNRLYYGRGGENVSEALPGVVYHYTSLDAMKKIVDSQSIWATSICYLNDVSEQECFLKMLGRLLPDFLRRNEVSSVHQQALSILREDVSPRFESRPFIASFSNHDDSLPQWRSYCRNGDGVAIGFRVDCLQRATLEGDGRTPSFRQVEYLSTDTDDADDVFNNLLKAVDSLGGPFDESMGDNAADWCRLTAMGIACFYKDESFRSEEEFRLVLDGVGERLELLQYRPVPSTLVPYAELRIPRWHSRHTGDPNSAPNVPEGRWQFIDRVVVGPSPDKELTRRAVDAFFRSRGLNVEVNSTHVPFREW